LKGGENCPQDDHFERLLKNHRTEAFKTNGIEKTIKQKAAIKKRGGVCVKFERTKIPNHPKAV